MRIVFMGTPEFAVPVLDALNKSEHEVVAVISQPDREKDKKGRLLATPVKEYAVNNGLRCLQFDRVSANVGELSALKCDIMITAAYGQLLSAEVLNVPPLGILNVHASLLPKYRGSSPIQSAILCGENETGVTIMKTDVGMDTGDIVSVEKVKIDDTDTSETLSAKLSAAGAELLLKTLQPYAEGKLVPVPQNHVEATGCKKIAKSDGNIDWSMSAHEIACKIRAYNPWPIAYSYLNGTAIKIYSATECGGISGTPGKVIVNGGEMYVACGKGGLKLSVVQMPGKRAMLAEEFLRGNRPGEGTILKNA